MTSQPITLGLSLAACALTATVAFAGSAEDGNAGLAALNRGAYPEAVRLFTRALKAGDLSREDQEFAYLNRGKAYLGENKKALALADLRKARELNPDDADARDALAEAGGIVRPAAASHPSVDPNAAWGPLAPLIGRTWMLISNQPELYYHYDRQADGRTVSFTGLDRAGNVLAGTYELDPGLGTVKEQVSFKGKTTVASVSADGNRFAEEQQSGNDYSRVIYTPAGPTVFQVEVQKYQPDSTWKTIASLKLEQTSQEAVDALGWKVAGPPKEPSFWTKLGRSLGNAVVQGVAAGLAAGVQGQPQQ